MTLFNPPFNRKGFLMGIFILVGLALLPASFIGCGADYDPRDEVRINPDWEARADKLEAHGALRTATNPGPWGEKIADHLPAASANPVSGQLTVITSHGMSAEHYITTLYIRNQDGVVIGLKELSPTDSEAKAIFTYPKGTIKVQAFSFCNLHYHWMAEKTLR